MSESKKCGNCKWYVSKDKVHRTHISTYKTCGHPESNCAGQELTPDRGHLCSLHEFLVSLQT